MFLNILYNMIDVIITILKRTYAVIEDFIHITHSYCVLFEY